MSNLNIEWIDAQEEWRQTIERTWGDKGVKHLHLVDGFTLLALCGCQPVGMISVYWRKLPAPLASLEEGYIDIIEVLPGFRRQGIAARLVDLAADRACQYGACQLRAWSSEDKVEAIQMWKALGFGLCPATTYPQKKEVKGYFVTRIL